MGPLEAAPAGSTRHGADEAGVTLRTVAEAIGRRLDMPVASVPAAEAGAHFGDPFVATVFATDAPASSLRTRALLDWTPTHPTLLQDLEEGGYFDEPPATRR